MSTVENSAFLFDLDGTLVDSVYQHVLSWHDALQVAGIELSHSGVHGENGETRWPTPGPTQLQSDYTGTTPMEMTKADIRRVQGDWVRAAERSREAGFDIVYVYGGHSYLPGQGPDDPFRDFVLDGEQILEIPVISLGPDMAAGRCFDKLGGDADAFTPLAHAAFDDVAHSELSPDVCDIDRPALEHET